MPPDSLHRAYRPDIDGLRAVAIALVVIFHAFPAFCPSGFIGVDVFFVISGYLITSNILKEIARFSFADFYARRFRRIVPAMAVVLAATWLVGRLFLYADEFKSLGEHVAYSAVFLENIKLAREINYYDVAAEFKPLLHFWSLGIEEQYYLIWPIILVLGFKLPKAGRAPFLFSFGLLSLGYRFSELDRTKVDFFYLLPARFWELLVGGALAYMQAHSRYRLVLPSACSFLAILALVAVSFFYTPPKNERDVVYLAATTLLPTLLTFGLIAAGPSSPANRNLLSHPVMIFIGKISYPLYLWHWPIFSFLRIRAYHAGTGPVEPAVLIAASGLAVALALATYRLIELPVQKTLTFSKRGKTYGYIGAALAILAVVWGTGTASRKGHLLTADQKRQEKFMDAYLRYKYDPIFIKRGWHDECNLHTVQSLDPSCYTPTAPKKVFLWGDSHAQHLNHGLRKYFEGRGVSLLQVTASLCTPSIDDGGAQYCNRSNEAALRYINETKPDVVVIALDKGHENMPWNRITQKLRDSHAKHVMIVGPLPHWDPSLYQIIARHYLDNVPEYLSHGLEQDVFVNDEKSETLLTSTPKASYLSLVKHLCKKDRTQFACRTLVGKDLMNDLISRDYAHLTIPGSEYIAQAILGPEIEKHLKRE